VSSGSAAALGHQCGGLGEGVTGSFVASGSWYLGQPLLRANRAGQFGLVIAEVRPAEGGSDTFVTARAGSWRVQAACCCQRYVFGLVFVWLVISTLRGARSAATARSAQRRSGIRHSPDPHEACPSWTVLAGSTRGQRRPEEARGPDMPQAHRRGRCQIVVGQRRAKRRPAARLPSRQPCGLLPREHPGESASA
jgi:hypothetical protein